MDSRERTNAKKAATAHHLRFRNCHPRPCGTIAADPDGPTSTAVRGVMLLDVVTSPVVGRRSAIPFAAEFGDWLVTGEVAGGLSA